MLKKVQGKNCLVDDLFPKGIGVRANINGNTWCAEGVAINSESGTAVVQAIAIPLTLNNGNGYGNPKKPDLRRMGNPSLTKQ